MMKRYFIEEAKAKVTDGGIACGPMSGDVVAAVKFKDGEQSKWLTLIDTTGITSTYLSDREIFSWLGEEEYEDDEKAEYIRESHISEFEGIPLGEDYDEILSNVFEQEENPAGKLLRYLIALIDCKEEEEEALIQMAVGKYVDEVNFPASEAELGYLEDREISAGDNVAEDNDMDDDELVVKCEASDVPEKGIKVLGMKAGAGDGYYTTIYSYHAEMHIEDNGESKYLLCSYCEGGFQFDVLPCSVIEGFVYEEGFLEATDMAGDARRENESYTELQQAQDSRYYEFFHYLRDYIQGEIRNVVGSDFNEDDDEDIW